MYQSHVMTLTMQSVIEEIKKNFIFFCLPSGVYL